MPRSLAVQSSRRMHIHLPHVEGIKGRPVSTGVITCAGAMVVAYTAYNIWRGDRTAVRRMQSNEICREEPSRIREAAVVAVSGRDVAHEDKITVPERMGPGKSGIMRGNIDPQGRSGRTNVQRTSTRTDIDLDREFFYNLQSWLIYM